MKNKLKTKKRESIGMQYKALSFEIKDITINSESRRISGYAAVFGNKDKAGDILIKGCFSKSIQERGPQSNANDKIIHLWMHNMNEPVGKIVTLIEDDKGLYFEADIDEIDLGDREIKQLESGTLNQFSIGYSYVWDKIDYDSEKDAFIVKEVVLYEISVVSIGCNGETYYAGLKTAEEIEDKEIELQNEIEGSLQGLSMKKKTEILGLFSKFKALMSVKPEEDMKNNLRSLSQEQAANNQRKSLFHNVKFK
ncbi:HK97 family phage prohead protease [Parabacteroides sp. AF48-14]|uniref:HK97 family phage prohead protease n=1 Tax=Parabacteroides sp. AF48-14 TaxID=2292052 RepID=UPI000EFECF64|nr:HK97 family phage prohead protease [Parabacteroides sp. AF48-14]RHO68247.1 HK97 family phage prohead protease [Parabacteroides sp. AF48-14]